MSTTNTHKKYLTVLSILQIQINNHMAHENIIQLKK